MPRREKDGGFHRPFAGLSGALGVEPKSTAAPAKVAARPPVKMPAPPEPVVSDAELFRQAVYGAAPLAGRSRVDAPPAPPPRPRASDDDEALAELADLCDGTGVFDFVDGDEHVEGVAEGIDRRLLRRLREGAYAVQAQLDLHGQSREAAHELVTRFVAESRRAGCRCVLIVHGRGLHSRDQVPVLKQAVKAWLERGAVSRAVLAFASARQQDGGAGAVYVLLRRAAETNPVEKR